MPKRQALAGTRAAAVKCGRCPHTRIRHVRGIGRCTGLIPARELTRTAAGQHRDMRACACAIFQEPEVN